MPTTPHTAAGVHEFATARDFLIFLDLVERANTISRAGMAAANEFTARVAADGFHGVEPLDMDEAYVRANLGAVGDTLSRAFNAAFPPEVGRVLDEHEL